MEEAYQKRMKEEERSHERNKRSDQLRQEMYKIEEMKIE